MSFHLMSLALDYGPEDANDRIIFLTLCERADTTSGLCWPSRADLMERSRLGYGTISRRLRSLEKAGWIQRKRRFNASTLFRVNVARLRKIEAERLVAKGKGDIQGFEPFEEEQGPQAIENKGTVQSGPTSVHSGPTIRPQWTPNLSMNQSLNPDALTPFQKACVQKGSSFLLNGYLVRGAELERLRLEMQRKGR